MDDVKENSKRNNRENVKGKKPNFPRFFFIRFNYKIDEVTPTINFHFVYENIFIHRKSINAVSMSFARAE